jgi:hypothetical protein
MGQAFQVLLDSGGLYLALGAILCIIIGIGAAKRLFQGAKRASPLLLNIDRHAKVDLATHGA